jgi:hypothetical protein
MGYIDVLDCKACLFIRIQVAFDATRLLTLSSAFEELKNINRRLGCSSS